MTTVVHGTTETAQTIDLNSQAIAIQMKEKSQMWNNQMLERFYVNQLSINKIVRYHPNVPNIDQYYIVLFCLTIISSQATESDINKVESLQSINNFVYHCSNSYIISNWMYILIQWTNFYDQDRN